jgi:hypothetical protein
MLICGAMGDVMHENHSKPSLNRRAGICRLKMTKQNEQRSILNE